MREPRSSSPKDLARRLLRKPYHRFVRPILRVPSNLRKRGFYRPFVGAHRMFFDVGANIGDRSDCFLSLGVSVVCVEPQPECVEILRARFQGKANVTIEAVGLDAEPGERVMHLCAEGSVFSTFADHWQTGRFAKMSFDEEVTVPMTTLDALIQKHGMPDFCKIDVEGLEFPVLSGLHSRIPCLNFEFTQEFFGDAERCIDRLTGLGYQEFNYTLRADRHLASHVWMPGSEVKKGLRVLCAQDSVLWGDVYARATA
jgi:FkbM family methyltransferase